MSQAPQIRIPATYMRGGTSKGVFFRLDDLPETAQVPGPARDALLMRVIGSPDPYQKQIDGLGQRLLQYQQDGHSGQTHPAGPRRGLPVWSGGDR